MAPPPNTAEKFWSLVDTSGGPDACWPWTRGGNGKEADYGVFQVKEQRRGAHVWAYIFAGGDVPRGHHVHHRCHQRLCCNPAHLELMTARRHMTISSQERNALPKTLCKNNRHDITQSGSTFEYRGWQLCRACDEEAKQRRKEKDRQWIETHREEYRAFERARYIRRRDAERAALGT